MEQIGEETVSDSELISLREEAPTALKFLQLRNSQKRVKNLFYLRDEYYFDFDAADDAVAFFENELFHVEGPKRGETLFLERWQRSLVRHIFGWKRKRDGLRKFRNVFIFIPRKNGKSYLSAGFALHGLFADEEPAARVISAAADKEQAALVFDVSREIVEGNPNFSDHCNTFRRSMAIPETGSNYLVVSSDVKTKHGKNLSRIIFDELHAQPNRDLYDVLFTSVGVRLQPLKIMLTTAGHDRESICFEEYTHAKRVAKGLVVDEEYLPIIFEAGPKDDWHSRETWKKANPNLGVAVTWDYFEGEYRKAVERPSYENTFRRLHLNQWTSQDVRWVPVEKWDLCDGRLNPPEFYHGRECDIGIDLSSKKDLTAVVALFFIDGKFHVVPKFWMPQDNIRDRVKVDQVDYDLWARAGFIETVPGVRQDYKKIQKYAEDFAEKHKVMSVGFDPWNAQNLITELDQNLESEVVEVPQTFKYLSDATKELEVLVLARQIIHGGNPVLRWMFDNVAVIEDGNGNVRISKKVSKERIDGLAATVTALSRWLMRERKKDSVYKKRGVRTIGQ